MSRFCSDFCFIFIQKLFLLFNISGGTDGMFRRACNRQYFFSTAAKTKYEAETECCKYGLKLLAIDSPEELSCLAEMNAGLKQNHLLLFESYHV